jgi:adenosylcobyric acid synthase
VSFRQVRAAQLDLLGDLVADHLDTTAILELLASGASVGLPTIGPSIT